MAFESLASLLHPPPVHAKPDIARVNPDGRNRQNSQGQQQKRGQEETAHPVPNTQGQITGKLIDITA